jgi:hypothetical protein
MLSADRFIANKALDFSGWVEARRAGVTATQVAKASTQAGFAEALADVLNPPEPFDNPYMAFGREQEGTVGLWIKERFGVFPNEWLISRDVNIPEGQPMEFATPDGLSLDHSVISEVKTTGKDWSDSVVPIQYRRQIQWQLHVTDAEHCILAWLLRAEVEGRMVPAWFEPKHMTVERDADMIEELVATANRLWLATQNAINERES